MTAHAQIVGVGSYLPETRLTNADLERMVETSDRWIVERTGISERRVVAEGEATSDLAARAVSDALDCAGLGPDAVDHLIVGTTSPDYVFPSTACMTQIKAGLSCPAVDVMAACTSFVYALNQGAALIESGRAKTVVVVGAEALTRHIDFTDRGTCVLFGDGAGAVVLQASDSPGVMSCVLGADGGGGDLLMMPSGGSAAPCTSESVALRDHFLKMNGNEVFKFAVRAIPRVTLEALALAGLSISDVDWLIPHQANQRILDTVEERLDIPHARVYGGLSHTGNTSAASIPLALCDLYTSGRLAPGNLLALVGFGAGLTWGAAIVSWSLASPIGED